MKKAIFNWHKDKNSKFPRLIKPIKCICDFLLFLAAETVLLLLNSALWARQLAHRAYANVASVTVHVSSSLVIISILMF